MTPTVTATQSSGLFIQPQTPDQIHTATFYWIHEASATATNIGVNQRLIRTSDDISEDAILAALPPLARWRYLAKNDRITFFIVVASFVVSLFALISAISVVTTIHALRLSLSAFAADSPTQTSSAISTTDIFVFAMLTIFGLWSLAAISLSKTPSTVTYAKDIAKVVLGFVAGFVGGARGR